MTTPKSGKNDNDENTGVTRIRAYLVIWGRQCEPTDITRRTGISPTKIWRLGDVRYAKTGKLHTDSGWQLESSETSDTTVDGHIGWLLSRVWQFREYLSALRPSCELQVTVVVRRG